MLNQYFRFLVKQFQAMGRDLTTAVMLAVMLTSAAVPAFAQEDLTLDVDLGLLFTNINSYLPVAFGIFAVIGGLMIAFRLARFLVNAFADALDGKNV